MLLINDFSSGKWQISLHTCSNGLNLSFDHFCKRTDKAFITIDDLLKIVDDGLFQAPNLVRYLQNVSSSFKELSQK